MMHSLLLALLMPLVVAVAGGDQPLPDPMQRHIPFAAGESARYRVGWGIFSRAGSATLSVTRDTLRADTVLHAVLAVRGGIPGARINERLETWMDPETTASRRFLQYARYPGFSRDRIREFDAVHRKWSGHTNAKPDSGSLPTAHPLDDLSTVFVARTIPLTVGQDVVLHDYWRPESNPIVLKVLRLETVKVPAGTFHTVVVRPIIRTSSLFAENGEAEVYLSTGEHRELVMLRAKLKLGTLVLRLERHSPVAPAKALE
ncbi:MAG TPA: DUF3108 domain-containing protein [Gemmatimonas sp.]|uniref:DUF3108 domain-containing protein n=1 Tax=Gemmatimonas sp. TaxID=1962908 RepID=UPI002EDBA568